MDFMQSETRINLARAFAGESQARNRYTIYADIARKEGQEYLARIFLETADNEKVHGEEFLEMIQKHAPEPQENIQIDAGYPFPFGQHRPKSGLCRSRRAGGIHHRLSRLCGNGPAGRVRRCGQTF